MERCLNKVVAGILPTDAVMHQTKYMKGTKKPRQMTAKAWIHRLSEMKEYLYWMSENNHTMDTLTFNQVVIKENIPLEWVVGFEKSSTARAINRSTAENQPALRGGLDELEQIEASEHVKRRVKNLKSKKGKHGDRKNYGDRKKTCVGFLDITTNGKTVQTIQETRAKAIEKIMPTSARMTMMTYQAKMTILTTSGKPLLEDASEDE